MDIETLALWIFVSSFVLPAVAFVAGHAAGVSPMRLAGVMVGFWVLSVACDALAVIGLSGGTAQSDLLSGLLITNGVLYALLVVPKILFGRAGQAPEPFPDQQSETISDEEDTACVPRLVNQGGGPVPYTDSGSSGKLGWVFWVANRYSWNLSINMTANNNSATGTASARGQFSAWHSITNTPRNATATVTGNVVCEKVEGKCAADASGGQDQDTDVDYTAAVVVNGGESGSKASLDVEAAVAVAGQLAISSVTLGGQIGGQLGSQGAQVTGQVSAAATINVPNQANATKKVSRTYAYRCSEVPVETI